MPTDRIRRLARLLLAAVAALSAVGAASAADWPLVWKVEAPNPIMSLFLVRDEPAGKWVVEANFETERRFINEDGVDVVFPMTISGPSLSSDMVRAVSADEMTFADLNRRTGEVRYYNLAGNLIWMLPSAAPNARDIWVSPRGGYVLIVPGVPSDQRATTYVGLFDTSGVAVWRYPIHPKSTQRFAVAFSDSDTHIGILAQDQVLVFADNGVRYAFSIRDLDVMEPRLFLSSGGGYIGINDAHDKGGLVAVYSPAAGLLWQAFINEFVVLDIAENADRVMAYGPNSGFVQLRARTDGRIIGARTGFHEPIDAAKISADGRLLAVKSGGELALFDISMAETPR